jgi:hypothetical protein
MIDRKPKVFAFGGGVQSTAVLVLSASGVLPYTHFIMCDVGHDSENPATIEYVHNHVMPYAQLHGLELYVYKSERNKKFTTLYEKMEGSSYAPIPIFVNTVPRSRSCTIQFKIKVMDEFMRRYVNATNKRKKPIGVVISLDEWHRSKRSEKYGDEGVTYPEYPLLDLKYTREDCIEIVKQAGLPEPPRSSCWFCPFHPTKHWMELKENRPDLFEKAVKLEQKYTNALDTAKATFHTSGKFLPELVDTDPHDPLYNCESGYCLT